MQHADYKEVATFYDKYWAYLDGKKLGGINSRHRFILQHLHEAGLKKNSKVLEIGCGLGMLTNFISKSIPQGSILGVDISPESVSTANKKYGNKNTSFTVSDMTDFNSQQVFDFIVFPDVLEHIPIEAHHQIFKTIRKLVHPNSKILINIPNPAALEYMHIHMKEALQIIDQPLHTDLLLKSIYQNDFYILSLKTYSIFFDQPDYQSMIIVPNVPFTTMTEKKKLSVISKSLWLRLANLFN